VSSPANRVSVSMSLPRTLAADVERDDRRSCDSIHSRQRVGVVQIYGLLGVILAKEALWRIGSSDAFMISSLRPRKAVRRRSLDHANAEPDVARA
jgi:hypothetical protein